MREYIKNYEFSGTLKIHDLFGKENVKCIYEDDVFSNKLMRGNFEVEYLSVNFINNFNIRKFSFSDKSGRTIDGIINGLQLLNEYKDTKHLLNFHADEYSQCVKYKDILPEVMVINFNIPYISILSRSLEFSYGLTEDYILKYSTPKMNLKLDIGI